MASGNSLIYSDANVFIAWFTNESTRLPGEMDGIQKVVEAFDSGNCVITTSMLTKAELLPSRLGADGARALSLFWKRKQFQPCEITESIIDLANEIRNFYREKNQKPPATPDSIHLATAIARKVDVFQTFDGNGKSGLLGLNGNVAGHNLRIQKPFMPQATLGLSP
jgi:predicted nucleic acid-binding protein